MTPIFSHRSVEATTTFDDVDLRGVEGATVSLILQARNTGYEREDFLEVFVTDGAERIDLMRLAGGADLTQRAGAGYATLAVAVPSSWERVQLVLSTSSNSSSGSEQFQLRRVEYTSTPASDVPPEITFLRGDANGDGALDLSDGIRILNFLFLGTGAIDCQDAADSNDTGDLDLSDGVAVFAFLFLGGSPPPAPGHLECGPDPTGEDLECDSFALYSG